MATMVISVQRMAGSSLFAFAVYAASAQDST